MRDEHLVCSFGPRGGRSPARTRTHRRAAEVPPDRDVEGGRERDQQVRRRMPPSPALTRFTPRACWLATARPSRPKIAPDAPTGHWLGLSSITPTSRLQRSEVHDCEAEAAEARSICDEQPEGQHVQVARCKNPAWRKPPVMRRYTRRRDTDRTAGRVKPWAISPSRVIATDRAEPAPVPPCEPMMKKATLMATRICVTNRAGQRAERRAV